MIANSMPKSFLYNSSWDFIRGQLYAENHSDIDNDRFTKKASLKSLGTEKVNVAVPIPDRTNRKIVLLTLFVTFAIVYSVLTIKEKKYALALEGYTGEKFAVGISWDKKTKEHKIKIEDV